LLVAVAALVSCGTTPAGAQPSKQAKQICSAEAQDDLTTALHLRPTTPAKGDWSNGTYTCRDPYPGAPVVMTVHDLPTLAKTVACGRGGRGGRAATGRQHQRSGDDDHQRPVAPHPEAMVRPGVNTPPRATPL